LILFDVFTKIFFSSNPKKTNPKTKLERQTMTERDSEKRGIREIGGGGGGGGEIKKEIYQTQFAEKAQKEIRESCVCSIYHSFLSVLTYTLAFLASAISLLI
jgi:hypothetical protein